MFEAIEKIDRVGVLNGFEASGHGLARLTLVYAGNGCGKSTLAAVFASAATGDASSLKDRQSLSATSGPHARLRVLGGQGRTLNGGTWAGPVPKTHVFDTEFVDRNVHTGGEVSPAHRQGFLETAIGQSAVDEQARLEAAKEAVNEAKAEMQRCEAELLAMARAIDPAVTFQAFQQMVVVPGVDAAVEAAELRLTAGKNVSSILALHPPVEVADVSLDLADVFEALVEGMSALHGEARRRVAEHINHLDVAAANGTVESWLRVGVELAPAGECPFCGQDTSGVALVDLYAEFFDAAYERLRQRMERVRDRLGSEERARVRERLVADYDRAREALTAWGSHLPMPQLPEITTVLTTLSAFGELFDEVLIEKTEHFDQPVCLGDRRSILETYVLDLPVLIEEVNAVIRAARVDIEAYRNSLSSQGVPQLVASVAAARLQQLRGSDNAARLFAQRKGAKKEMVERDGEASAARQASKEAMNTTLARLETDINWHLNKMRAAFSIEKVASTYAGGGTGRSSYGLQLRGQSIDIARGKPPFRLALSEGDKRSLAYAFFCATVLRTPDLSGQVVVVDDPVTSLDKHRREHTTNTLEEMSRRGAQVIVLAHDATYLRQVRELLTKKPDNQGNPRASVELQLQRTSSGNSSLDAHNLDRECESKYFRNYRLVRTFVENRAEDGVFTSHLDAGNAVRPLLESYLHRRFPGSVPNQTLGKVIGLIRSAPDLSVLAYAKPLADELEEINRFSSRFHHDTDSDFAGEQPDRHEIQAYATRALNVVHGDPSAVIGFDPRA